MSAPTIGTARPAGAASMAACAPAVDSAGIRLLATVLNEKQAIRDPTATKGLREGAGGRTPGSIPEEEDVDLTVLSGKGHRGPQPTPEIEEKEAEA